MIAIERSLKSALTLRLDGEGCTELKQAFERLSNQDAVEVVVELHPAVFHRRGRVRSVTMKVRSDNPDPRGMANLRVIDPGNILLQIDGEDLEQALVALEYAQRHGYFEVAEFTLVKVLPGKRHDHLYWAWC